MKLTLVSSLYYLGLCLEGLLFGLYSGFFGMYLQYHHASSKKQTNANHNITFYAICVLYVLSVVDIAVDVGQAMYNEKNDFRIVLHLEDCRIVIFACCDFIAQSILIYRCWIVWGQNTRVVIVPSILAFAFLPMWMTQLDSYSIGPRGIAGTSWGNNLGVAGLAASMTVNALVTSLIVLKIFKASRGARGATTSVEKSVVIAGGIQFRPIIFVIIESAMALFAIQLTRLTIGIIILWSKGNPGFHSGAMTLNGVYDIIVSMHEMLNGITPTIILVRVAMGFSFHDEPSLEESIDSLRFATDHSTPMHGMGSLDSMDGFQGLHMGSDEAISIPLETEYITEVRSGGIWNSKA